MRKWLVFSFAIVLVAVMRSGAIEAQSEMTNETQAGQTNAANEADKGSVMVTIFLRHDQSKTLDEINAHLDRTGYWKEFPPEGVEVVSWYVMMGIGQVVTLRLPAHRLRDVNLAIERNAWGAFRTEFYPTYDFRPIWQELSQQAN